MGWEVVDEVEPIALYNSNLGNYFYVLLILPYYASRHGLGLSVSMTDVRLLINGLLKIGCGHLENPVLS